jgi:hypothetical protein
MVTKAKTNAVKAFVGTYPRKALTVTSGPSEEEKGRAFATQLNSSELAAYRIISIMQPKSLAIDIDTPTLLDVLREQSEASKLGDLSNVEAMLITQATALQSMFVRMCEQATDQSMRPNFEAFMRLALKAQAQCRVTLETLATIKNPPIVYANQANVTTGPQQINNNITDSSISAGGFKNKQNQLSGDVHELCQNTGASRVASPINPSVAPMGEVNRS